MLLSLYSRQKLFKEHLEAPSLGKMQILFQRNSMVKHEWQMASNGRKRKTPPMPNQHHPNKLAQHGLHQMLATNIWRALSMQLHIACTCP